MKHLIFTKPIAAVAITLGAFVAASSAHAGSDVYFSVGVQVPGFYLQSSPVYVQPRAVYVPAPVYHGRFDEGRRYDRHQWQSRGPYGDHDRDGIANIYDRGSPRHQSPQARLYGPYGDLDRDGFVNRRDRDRDGDGVPNRYDHRPNNPYRR